MSFSVPMFQLFSPLPCTPLLFKFDFCISCYRAIYPFFSHLSHTLLLFKFSLFPPPLFSRFILRLQRVSLARFYFWNVIRTPLGLPARPFFRAGFLSSPPSRSSPAGQHLPRNVRGLFRSPPECLCALEPPSASPATSPLFLSRCFLRASWRFMAIL